MHNSMLKAWLHLFICTISFCAVKIDMREPSTGHYYSMWLFFPLSYSRWSISCSLCVSPYWQREEQQDAPGFNEAAPCSLTRDVRIIVDVGLGDGMLNAFIGCEYERKKNTQGPGIQSKKPKGNKEAIKIKGTFIRVRKAKMQKWKDYKTHSHAKVWNMTEI